MSAPATFVADDNAPASFEPDAPQSFVADNAPSIDVGAVRRSAIPVNQPSEYSSGLPASVPISENPDWAYTKAVVNDPSAVVNDLSIIPKTAMAVAELPGKAAYRAAADVIAKTAKAPSLAQSLKYGVSLPAALTIRALDRQGEYGGNLSAPPWENVLPVDKFLAEVSKTDPKLATAGKVGKSLAEMSPLMAVGMLPRSIATLAGAGFTAQMIAAAPEQLQQYAEEINKPVAEQDPDKISLQSDILLTFTLAPLIGGAVARGTVKPGAFNPAIPFDKIIPTVKDAFGGVRIEPKAAPEYVRKPMDWTGTQSTVRSPQSPVEPPKGGTPSVPPVLLVSPQIGDQRRLAIVQCMAAGEPIAAADLQPGEDALLTPAGYQLQGDQWVRQSALDVNQPEIGAKAESPQSTVRSPAVRAAVGTDWTASTPVSGDKVSGQWEVVDLPDILTSNHPDYEQALQPRDVNRAARKEQILKMAAGWEPQRAGESPTTDTGAPILDQYNQAVTANGRLAALRLVYAAGTERAGAYKHFVQQKAAEFGIDPAKIAAMESPVLVRRVTNLGDLTMPDLARLSNESVVLGMSAAEKAGRDAQMLRDNPGLMDTFLPSEEGDVLAASNRGFLNAFVQGSGDHAELLNADGSWNAKTIAPRVKNAVLGALLGGENRSLLNDLIDRPQELNIAKAAAGVMQAAPRLMKHRGTIYDLGGVLNQALADLVRVRSAGQKVGEFLDQHELIGDPQRTAESDFLLEQLAGGASGRQIAEALARYADMARRIDLNTGDMFGASPTPRPELLRRAYEKGNEPKTFQPDLTKGEPGAVPPKAEGAAGDAQGGVQASPGFGGISGGFDLGAESVDAAKARLEAEQLKSQNEKLKSQMEDRAQAPLRGTSGDLGQKDMFGKQDLFGSPPAIGAGGEIGPEPARGDARPTSQPIADDPWQSVMDAAPLGMQEGVQLVKALTGSFPKIKEKLVALGGRAAGLFRHTEGEMRSGERGVRSAKGSVELKAGIFDVITGQEKADLRQQAEDYARLETDNKFEQRKIAEERYQFLLDEMRKRELPLRHSVEALKVIFHEIGHVIDWLPDYMIKGRGNFFGHIAALKSYFHNVMPLDPRGPMGGLPDKAKLRAEAERQIREEIGPIREIVRQIVVEEPEWKITGITPADITNILKESAGKGTPDLTRWFAEQDSKTKAEVLRKAMRGLLDERLAAMGKKEQIGTRTTTRTVREKVGREPTVAEIKARFAELLAKEMQARNLADLEAVRAEMKPAIAWWRGTAEMEPYFNNGPEMYAEAFSMLFNNPAGFAKRAPVTARLLWNYMERRPQVSELYDKIQSQIKSGEIYKVRVENLHDMWARDNDRSLEAGRAQRHVPWADFYQNVAYHIDRMGGPVYRAARGAKNEGALREAWGNFLYRAAEHERYFSTGNREVGGLLVRNNLDWNHDFGEYLYHNRVLKERFNPIDGTPLANPLGWDVKDSTARLEEMRQQLGPERWAALEEAGKRFYQLHQDFVVDAVKAGRMFTPELNKILTDRTAYATFAAVKNLPDNGIERLIETQFGPQMTPHIYRQLGNLGEIKNPATATMLKGASLISAVARNTLKRELVKALFDTEDFPGQNIREAPMVWDGRKRSPKIVDGPNVGTILYLEHGKPRAFYVRRLVADSVNGDNPLANHAASALQKSKGLLKGLFTQQPGFWAFNYVRDTAGLWAQMPGIRAPIGTLLALPRAVVAARASVKGTANKYAEQALKRRMLISRMEQTGSWSEVRDEYDHRVSGYGFDPAAWNKEMTLTERALHVWHEWMGWGKVIERTNKLAGMIYLDEYAPAKYRNAPDWQKREWVRGMAGSPDFLERGKAANAIDWAFLFYNPWKEGMRSLVKAARTDPIGMATKASALMIMPTVLQAMAYNGAFGEDAKKRYRAVGLYDLTNYLIPHVGTPDKSGAVALFRLPLFEPHRVLHGVLFQLLTGQSEGMLNHAGGQLPGLNPIVPLAYQWGQYLLGDNPLDFRRSANLLTDQQQAARGGAHGRPGEVFNASALATMAQQTWNNLGMTVLYRFRNLNLENPPDTTTQKILNAPVLNNIIGRWYKVSNTGVADQARLAAAPVAQRDAIFDAAKDVMLEKIVTKYWPALAKQAAKQPLTGDDYALLKQPMEWTPAERALMRDPEFQQFMLTRTAAFQRRFAEIMMSRMSPQMRALGIGSSRAQDAAILKAMQP